MKKRILAIILIVALTSFLNAEGFDTKVSVGASSAKIKNDRYTQYGIGYTSNTNLNSGIIFNATFCLFPFVLANQRLRISGISAPQPGPSHWIVLAQRYAIGMEPSGSLG